MMISEQEETCMNTLQYREIPLTSTQHYISGFEALNTPDELGRVSDWHPLTYWQKTPQKIEISLYDNLLGHNQGISYRKINYSQEKQYIANFPRAVADIVMANDLLIGKENLVNDYILTEKETIELFDYLFPFRAYAHVHDFLVQELSSYYLEMLQKKGEV